MNKISILLALCVLAGIVMSGCSGVADSGTDRWSRHQQIREIERRQAVDDWDYFWLLDRSSHMTYYHPRVGR